MSSTIVLECWHNTQVCYIIQESCYVAIFSLAKKNTLEHWNVKLTFWILSDLLSDLKLYLCSFIRFYYIEFGSVVS